MQLFDHNLEDHTSHITTFKTILQINKQQILGSLPEVEVCFTFVLLGVVENGGQQIPAVFSHQRHKEGGIAAGGTDEKTNNWNFWHQIQVLHRLSKEC